MGPDLVRPEATLPSTVPPEGSPASRASPLEFVPQALEIAQSLFPLRKAFHLTRQLIGNPGPHPLPLSCPQTKVLQILFLGPALSFLLLISHFLSVSGLSLLTSHSAELSQNVDLTMKQISSPCA